MLVALLLGVVVYKSCASSKARPKDPAAPAYLVGNSPARVAPAMPPQVYPVQQLQQPAAAYNGSYGDAPSAPPYAGAYQAAGVGGYGTQYAVGPYAQYPGQQPLYR